MIWNHERGDPGGIRLFPKQLGIPRLNALSGGVGHAGFVLARLLLSAPDALLLDEPTNHLDLDSLLWLKIISFLPGNA